MFTVRENWREGLHSYAVFFSSECYFSILSYYYHNCMLILLIILTVVCSGCFSWVRRSINAWSLFWRCICPFHFILVNGWIQANKQKSCLEMWNIPCCYKQLKMKKRFDWCFNLSSFGMETKHCCCVGLCELVFAEAELSASFAIINIDSAAQNKYKTAGSDTAAQCELWSCHL